MNSRCPRAKPVFYLNGLRANKLFGWRLSFNRYANIIKDKNSFVPIGLWKITKHCEKELDIYENFPILYSKIYLKYKSIKTMTYVMNSNKLLKTGFKKNFSVNYAINEIIEAYNEKKIKDKDKFYTVKWMKKIGL